MSTTPPDFPIVSDRPTPDPEPREDTGSFVTSRQFRPVAEAVQKLVGIERERRGEIRILTWLVGIALPLGVAFFAWMTLRLEDIRSDARDTATRVELLARDRGHE